MSPFSFIRSSLRHYRRIHLAVAAGVSVATAVLTGALLVGDSVRGSLRGLTLERLGRIDSALVANHMFRAELAEELSTGPRFQEHFSAAEPAILMTGTLQSGSGDALRRATQVSLIGCRDEFWRLGNAPASVNLHGDEIAITEPLARELAVAKGESVLVRVPHVSAMPSDSILGEKSETSRSRPLRVGAVLPVEGLARFALEPSQHAPRNAFVPLDTLQNLLDQMMKANAILVATENRRQPSSEEAQRALRESLRPTLDDYGLKVTVLDSPWRGVQISASQLVLPDAVIEAADEGFEDDRVQPVVTYLANRISVGEGNSRRSIPYSTITGVDSTAALGPLLDESGRPIRLGADEIALNRWAADDLEAEIGDIITIAFYEPESTHGQLREHAPVSFRLVHIAELEDSSGQPTAAADPNLTPELPGVTDQESIEAWELPFELVETIRSEDEDYWDEYRTTPKAFLSLATAKRLWPSRWGTISLLRIPLAGPLDETGAAAEKIAERLKNELDPESLGMTFLPVKAQGLAAASGTTPFDGLFLGFSFFLIAAAVMLIALLFQLGVEQRVRELGILATTGASRKKITGLLSNEGVVVAAIGALVGIAAGVGYAWLMIAGLRTWWIEAIATPFLELHVTPRSLVVGWITGVLVCWLTVRWSIRRLVRLSASRLLTGQTDVNSKLRNSERVKHRRRLWPVVRLVLIVVGVTLLLVGWQLEAEAQAGIFFGLGAVALTLMLGEIRAQLRAADRHNASPGRFNLAALSALNTARNPARSTLTIGLVASASFLIVAISAFRLDSTEAGTGGFDLVATSDRPIHFDLNEPDGQIELGFSDEASERLEDWRVYSVRVAAGEDASCLNLYRPRQPRVLGVPKDFIDRGGFAFATTMEMPEDDSNPNAWKLLHIDLGRDSAGRPVIPVILDRSTAYYSLQLGGLFQLAVVGKQLEIRDSADQPVTLQVVGLLKNSVLQGNLLVSEASFLRMFPDIGGYRFFLIERTDQATHGVEDATEPAERSSAAKGAVAATSDIAGLLETALDADGFDAVDAEEQLAAYLAVQNTYLSTFQSLGALGLLLGTIGLAIVQLRSVIERHGELALMRAEGFPRKRLVQMVLWENAVLLVGGLVVGCVAAAIATLPQWSSYDAEVPWKSIAAILVIIALVGLAAGWLATRSALRAPLVPALRGE